jgi:hypothetical protein
MSQPSPRPRPHPIRNVLRGLGNIIEFLRESALAVVELVIGRWPQPFGELRKKPTPPNQGLGPIEKIAPFPTED